MSSERFRKQAIEVRFVVCSPNDSYSGSRNRGAVLLNPVARHMRKVTIDGKNASETAAMTIGAMKIERSTGEDRSWR